MQARLCNTVRGSAALFSAALVLVCLFAVEAFAVGGAGAKPGWTLRVAPAAAVSGERVMLGEIASPGEDFPEQVWTAMSTTPLWKAPRNRGASMVVAADKLYNALRYYLRDAPVTLSLPKQIVIRRGGGVILRETLRRQLVEYLTPRLKELGGRAEMSSIQVPPYVFVDAPDTSPTFEAKGGVRPGRNMVSVMAVSGTGRNVKKGSAQAVVEVFKTVPAALRVINPIDGEIKAGMVAWAEKNLAKIGRGRIWDGTGGPWRVKKPVPPGGVIFADNLESLPLIFKGDMVTLAYRGKNIRLSLPVEALTDGALNGKITVQNLQSKRRIVGKVKDRNTVLVR